MAASSNEREGGQAHQTPLLEHPDLGQRPMGGATHRSCAHSGVGGAGLPVGVESGGHSVADAELGHPLPHLDDDAGAVAAGDQTAPTRLLLAGVAALRTPQGKQRR